MITPFYPFGLRYQQKVNRRKEQARSRKRKRVQERERLTNNEKEEESREKELFYMYTPSYLAGGVFSSLFLAKVRSPTGLHEAVVIICYRRGRYGNRPEGTPGTYLSVFPPRCAIMHRRDTPSSGGEESRTLLSLSHQRSLQSSVSHPPSYIYSILYCTFSLLTSSSSFIPNFFSAAFVYYMLNYN